MTKLEKAYLAALRAVRRGRGGNPTNSSRNDYPPMTGREKACAERIIPEMIREYKQGRWQSRKQAIAVGLSKARTKC